MDRGVGQSFSLYSPGTDQHYRVTSDTISPDYVPPFPPNVPMASCLPHGAGICKHPLPRLMEVLSLIQIHCQHFRVGRVHSLRREVNRNLRGGRMF
ncbi:hypothetical protein CEXT_714691 [Caerostris extrusa]|uniref:Uncharacterized protein n=1 Tax=Caerostris extrusa TaxID=172846 RepID=A0AAV4PP59_CAEEX|nr:hypothetical protein CEXT_714691 [Caerostris extrusa]